MAYKSPYQKGYDDGYSKGHSTGYWKAYRIGQSMNPAADRFWATVTVATLVMAFVIAIRILID